jgi:hypothetical protein
MFDPNEQMKEALAKLKELHVQTATDVHRMSPELRKLIVAAMNVFRADFQKIRDLALESSETEPEFYELLDEIDAEITAIIALATPPSS